MRILLIGCSVLIESGDLTNPKEVESFFEKPWKWSKELEQLHIKTDM